MLQELFMNIITMSLTAVPIIVAVLLARMVLKFAPKIFSYALWAVVLFRLLCPFSFEMNFSLVPNQIVSGEVVESYAESYVGDVEIYEQGTPEYNEALEQGMKPATDSASYIVVTADGAKQAKTLGESLVPVLSVVWIVGIVALVLCCLASLIQLKKQLVGSVPYRGNAYLADHIDSPFVLGIINPKIYLPSTMEESEYSYTLLHEIYHIRRGDHVVKLVAFAALYIHWFNPLVWIAFVLAMTDMEMSCDEAVLSQIGESVKGEYSVSLLGFASGKQYVPATFLAFGEVNPKARIKNVLKWKKPVVIFSVIAAVLAVFVGVLCLSNPLLKNYPEKTSSIVSNNNRNLTVAEDEEYIYFVNTTEVKKISKKDSIAETIYEFEDIENLVNAFEYFDGRLYFITYNYDFISINTNGGYQITSKLSTEMESELLEGSFSIPDFHVFGGDLYLLTDAPTRAYRVNPNTLDLEEADHKIAYQYQTEEGIIFSNKIENGVARLYVTSAQGEEKLFSAEDESVISPHYTNAYVFYQAFKLDGSESQYDKLYLYRVDLDGRNKVLVKEMVVADVSGDILYDNEYAYIYMNKAGYMKIHKETLKKIAANDLYLGAEVSNGKFFAYGWSYFIESETHKIMNLDMTKEEAYKMLEEKYAFRPVEFGYLPEGVVFESVQVNLEERYSKLRYEGPDGSWIDLYVAERYMSTDPRFFLNVNRVLYDTYSEDEVTSYTAESKQRGPTEVRVYKSRISDAPVIESYFAGTKSEEYVIQSYNIPQEEYNIMIENLMFDE